MCDHSCKEKETHFRNVNVQILLWVEDCSGLAKPPRFCLIQPVSQGRTLATGQRKVPSFYQSFTQITCVNITKMSFLVSLHPSHTQMARKDFHFYFLSLLTTLFHPCFKCQCSQDLIFGPGLSSNQLIHPQSLHHHLHPVSFSQVRLLSLRSVYIQLSMDFCTWRSQSTSNSNWINNLFPK